MRAVIQVSKKASVSVEGEIVGKIEKGYVVLLGVEQNDQSTDAAYMADKIANLRIFEDDDGKLNKSIIDCGGEILLISQFTLLGDSRKGRRPGFTDAARPEQANKLYLEVVEILKNKGIKVETGKFQTHMEVSLINDGPCTILLDSKKIF